MAPVVSASQSYGFNDGNGGHVCTFSAGSPSAGDIDILCVNSDTVVSTPAGFTLSVTAVTNEGTYIFTRKANGGESASVTITTAGNFNSGVIWVRVTGGGSIEITGVVQVNNTPGTSTPAFTSGALLSANELALAFAALHGFTGPNPNTPVWTGPYSSVASSSFGGSGSGCVGFVADNVPTGPGTESPSVSWTATADDRYLLFVSVTPSGIPDKPAKPVVSPSSSAHLETDTSTSRQAASAIGATVVGGLT